MLTQAVDLGDARCVVYNVLWHGAPPPPDANQLRSAANSKNLMQLAPGDLRHFVVAEIHCPFCRVASEETAKECALARGPVWKLVLREGASQEAATFGARNEKTKAFQRCAEPELAIAEVERD